MQGAEAMGVDEAEPAAVREPLEVLAQQEGPSSSAPGATADSTEGGQLAADADEPVSDTDDEGDGVGELSH